tara:strand:+ start:226 stop:471 length:246 start_codon:yes stop_codon:yes gene_type:complete
LKIKNNKTMRENLKKEVYKIVENGEHINTLDATNRIVNLTDDYIDKKMIELINKIIDTYLLDNISLRALQLKKDELINNQK